MSLAERMAKRREVRENAVKLHACPICLAVPGEACAVEDPEIGGTHFRRIRLADPRPARSPVPPARLSFTSVHARRVTRSLWPDFKPEIVGRDADGWLWSDGQRYALFPIQPDLIP